MDHLFLLGLGGRVGGVSVMGPELSGGVFFDAGFVSGRGGGDGTKIDSVVGFLLKSDFKNNKSFFNLTLS